MAKHVALLSFVCLLLSCSNKNNKPDYASLIKGDWLGQKQTEGFEHDQTEFLSFEDSTCHAPFMHDVIKYEILQGALYLTTEKEDKKGPRNKFTIVKLTADSLVLLSGKKQLNTIKYIRIYPKNNISPAVIYFASSGCFGTCPAMHLEIDRDRNVRFYGVMYTKITGGYKGKLSENVYSSIISKIRNLPVDSLKQYYSCSWSDMQTMGVAIVHDNTVTRSTSYGHENEPIELHILFSQLVNLYKEMGLQPDSTVNEKYFDSKLSVMPIMSPPPKSLRKEPTEGED